ncbi:MAG: TIGR03619 family F420-dependent LLM class oxidoreductase [Halieaceae bacterium]|jgi:probable F420-dependent oxidoreductase|nr:TIGR03619 family F420-dependent LLM class oxidoreductase [Halieaceae bacterium]MBT6126787.1 TIGR03619 family F420-dependent LLM class oxidoreductase [Halieaceae bacterium]MBT7720526.1 TIGR03619 family F420-dependent LLM class oxidoreductase [Halieaceae bacterium]
MKFWQPVSWAETEQLCDIARFAEQCGFEGLMGADHALFPQAMAPDYPYSDTGLPPQTADHEYPDMWSSFAAMAAVTTRIKLVCGVYVLPIRNPIEVAKQAATLAILSEGRFALGAGTGWMKEEFDAYGVSFKGRGKRMDEMLDIMQGLWTGEWFEYHGQHFDFPPIQVSPHSKYQVPLYFGGTAKVALRRAARIGDGWIGAGNAAEDVPRVMSELQELRKEYGRDHLPFDSLVGVYAIPDKALFDSLYDSGMTSGLNMPFAYALGTRSSLDDKKRMMAQFAEDVIRHF